MKKLILSLVMLAIAIPSVNAQWWSGGKEIEGNGDMVSERRSLSDYDEIDLQGSIDVLLVAGPEGDVKVEAESNLMEHILTEVSGGKLKIYVEEGVNLNPSRNREILVTVPFETLKAVSLTGSGDINTSDRIVAKDFGLQVTGSGDMNLDVEAERLSGGITGSGDVQLRGKTTQFNGKVTGSGDFDALGLEAELVEATVSGSGDISVTANRELKARVSGSGDITYSGNPGKQDFNTTGSGAVSKK